jgi:hypothetical protein
VDRGQFVFSELLLFLVTLLAFFAAIVLIVIIGVWLVARRVRRSRTFNRGRLLARSATAPNRQSREIGRLRVSLFDGVNATGRVLNEVPAPAVLRDMAHELNRAAAIADHRLGLLAAEPDRQLLDRLVPALRTSVTELNRAAADVRATAWAFARLSEPQVQALTLEVADQIAGLRAGLAEVQAIRAANLHWT